MQSVNLKMNPLPAPTWRWLHINDCAVSFPDNPEGSPAAVDFSDFAEIRGGAGEEFNDYMQKANTAFQIIEGTEPNPIRLPFSFSGETTLQRFGITLKEAAEAVFIMDFSSDEKEGYAGIQTKVRLEDKAQLTLVQIHRCGDSFTLMNDLGISVGKEAAVKIIHVMLSGKQTVVGAEVTLQGDKSAVEVNNAYLVEQDHQLDMNYNIPIYGKQTRSDLVAKGVLRDTAKKTMRDTLDFKTGCAGSSGDEMEDVMLLSDGIINQSVPLILCQEEDVEGNHGASIGRLSRELLFYLESRGIPEADLYELLAKARLDAVINLIPDPETQEKLRQEEGESLC